jgi:acetylornithine deacetylase
MPGAVATTPRAAAEHVDLLLALLREPDEAGAQRVLAEALDAWGIATELWTPQPEHVTRFVEQETWLRGRSFAERPNLTAWLGTTERPGAAASAASTDAAEPCLLLNGHVDVVPADPSRWGGDPFEPERRDGRIRARGAADAKGPLAAMACAMAVVRGLDVELRRPVTLHAVVDEEGGGGGTLACLGRGVVADAAIVGEPTGLQVCPATRGSRRLRVSVHGRAAHPGEAFLGVNAIAKARLLLDAVEAVAARLDATRPHPLWAHLPVQHVFNVCSFQGGAPGLGAVPDQCAFEVALGGTAAETLDELEEEVRRAITDAAAADPWLTEHPPELSWGALRLLPSSTDPGHPLVTTLAGAVQEVTGRQPVVGALSGVTDARHLVHYGGIPTLTFGPGAMHVAHTHDEWIDVDEYLAAVAVLATTIVRVAGRTERSHA